MAATFLGIASQLVGIFQNAKTIRKMFQKKFARKINKLVIESERKTRESTREVVPVWDSSIWACSSSHADNLRERSWEGPVVGATVPQPFEYLNRYSQGGSHCLECFNAPFLNTYTSVGYPHGFSTSILIPSRFTHYN